MMILFEHASEEEYNKLRTQAIFNACAFAGEDPGEAKRVKKNSTHSQSLSDQSPSFPVFKHPDAYKDMPTEERQALTAKMMGKHKEWAEGLSEIGKD